MKYSYKIIPDEQEWIEQSLRELSDEFGADLIVTTGGTGLTKRDVTPEATKTYAKMLPDLRAYARSELKICANSDFIKAERWNFRNSLIINLPGKPANWIKECLEASFPSSALLYRFNTRLIY